MNQVSSDDSVGGPSLAGYLTGFVLALVLTLIPFGLVAFQWLSKGATLIAVGVAAVVQILVHLYFFLHLNLSPENRWNAASGVFAALILFIMVGGTIWLFWSLHARNMIGPANMFGS